MIFGCDIYDFTVDAGLSASNVRSMVRDGGLSFMNAKVTEMAGGSVWTHSRALQMLTVAKEEGLTFPMGFVVPRTGTSPKALMDRAQADLDRYCPWWRNHPTFSFQVDTEAWSYDRVSVSNGVAVAKYIRDTLKRRVAAVYAPDWAYESTNEISQIKAAGFRWWSSEYRGSGGHKTIYANAGGDSGHPGWRVVNGVTPTINQFSQNGRVPGYGGNLVVSVIKGTESNFANLLGAGTPAPPPEEEPDAVGAISGSEAQVLAKIAASAAKQVWDVNTYGWRTGVDKKDQGRRPASFFLRYTRFNAARARQATDRTADTLLGMADNNAALSSAVDTLAAKVAQLSASAAVTVEEGTVVKLAGPATATVVETPEES